MRPLWLWSVILLSVLMPLLKSAHSAGSGEIRFEEIAERTGLKFATRNSPTPNKYQIEPLVAGVAVFDYDGDGYLDVFFVNGAAIPSLRKESPEYWNRLFHNNRNGTFTDVTEKAGVAGSGYGMGVAVGDFDNDGRPDLYVANVGMNQLLHNNGNGTFTDVTARAGVSGAVNEELKMWSTGAGWFDYNNDGLLDLFVVNYCKWTLKDDPYCVIKTGVRAYCHPKEFAPLHNTLYRNNGDGTFTDVSQQTGISSAEGRGMSVSFADMDGDGFMDAFVANDTSPNFLFHNIGGRRFEEIGVTAGVAYAPDGNALSGMGSDFRDVNNDGKPDIWHTAVEHETFPLYLNHGKRNFVDATAASGLGGLTKEMSGWGNGIFDFDNDGWKDLFVARSNVMDNIDLAIPGRHHSEPNALLRNSRKGTFEDVSGAAGEDFQREAVHRGVAFGDLDNDGRIDMVVTVLGGSAKLLRNVTESANHWVEFHLIGTASNRMGLGAQIRITSESGAQQWNQLTTAVGYAGSSDSRVHFGLGQDRHIKEVLIYWPAGAKQILHPLEPDRVVTVTEPKR